MWNMWIHNKTPAEKAKEAQEKLAEDFQLTLDRMTPAERKQFWKQHETDTGGNTAKNE